MKDELKVAAVVVTHNRKELLKECLQALLNQTRPLDEIIVIDNASTDGTNQMIRSEFPEVTYVRLPENIGGAGGFCEGMKRAYEKGYDWIWVMDDDALPDKACLERLLDATVKVKGEVFIPILRDVLGRMYGVGYWQGRYVPINPKGITGYISVDLFSFVGPLFSSNIVSKAGYPRKEFFICFDDVEYALRIKRIGGKSYLVPDALISHTWGLNTKITVFLGRKSVRSANPPWKFYYEARNHLYTITRIYPTFSGLIWYIYMQARYLIGDLIYEPNRWTLVQMRLQGVVDGLLGHLGKTYFRK